VAILLNKLSEEDVAVLRGPIESGRQSPRSLGSNLVLAIFLQALLFYLTYYIAAESTIYPNVERIRAVHLWVTAVLILLSIIYAIPAVYKRSERFQYFLTILVSQNLFAVFFYLSSLFLIGEGTGITIDSLLDFTFLTLSIGGVLFIALCIRFYLLLRKGYYRKGSKQDKMRGKLETNSYLPIVIIASVGLFFILQSIVRTFHLADLEMIVLITVPLLLYYGMIFVLPEQLMILYCKFRFNCFTFNKRAI
jgi:hypothetical protein